MEIFNLVALLICDHISRSKYKQNDHFVGLSGIYNQFHFQVVQPPLSERPQRLDDVHPFPHNIRICGVGLAAVFQNSISLNHLEQKILCF